jgi:carbonic anhydrase/acetyltransferase-like protein (isoleucine patch superfamily)
MPLYALDDVSPEVPEAGRYWIAPDAHVIGRVRLGLDVGIWFGAVLRGDNEIIDVGAATNIQEGAMLHTDLGAPLLIGAGCTVGHHAILHGGTLGENTRPVRGRVFFGQRSTCGPSDLIGRPCIG